MNILAIDTSLSAVAACVFNGADASVVAKEGMAMQRGHAEALLPMVDRVVARLEGRFTALERVAVTIGPGSFTGIRVGIAAARAIALACNVPVVGVSTLAAFAAPLITASDSSTIACAIDALHGNLYVAVYAAMGRCLLSPRILPVRDAVRQLGSGRLRMTGSGAEILAAEAWAIGLRGEIVGDLIAPDIAYVARLGLLADPEQSAARPVYLKAPDARPQEGGRIARTGS